MVLYDIGDLTALGQFDPRGGNSHLMLTSAIVNLLNLGPPEVNGG
jgi:hypothetical protein